MNPYLSNAIIMVTLGLGMNYKMRLITFLAH